MYFNNLNYYKPRKETPLPTLAVREGVVVVVVTENGMKNTIYLYKIRNKTPPLTLAVREGWCCRIYSPTHRLDDITCYVSDP
jgi:hypothetical protein